MLKVVAKFETVLASAQGAFSNGDHATAEKYFQCALSQAEISYGYDSEATGIVALNYIDFLCQHGRFDDSRPLLKRLCKSLTNKHYRRNNL